MALETRPPLNGKSHVVSIFLIPSPRHLCPLNSGSVHFQHIHLLVKSSCVCLVSLNSAGNDWHFDKDLHLFYSSWHVSTTGALFTWWFLLEWSWSFKVFMMNCSIFFLHQIDMKACFLNAESFKTLTRWKQVIIFWKDDTHPCKDILNSGTRGLLISEAQGLISLSDPVFS